MIPLAGVRMTAPAISRMRCRDTFGRVNWRPRVDLPLLWSRVQCDLVPGGRQGRAVPGVQLGTRYDGAGEEGDVMNDNQQWAIDLCEALGIDHTKVTKVELVLEAGGITYVTVTSYVEPKSVEQVIRRYRLEAHEADVEKA